MMTQQHIPYVTVKAAASLIGLTEKAIRRKIERGDWVEGGPYRRAPDGAIYISIEGFKKWVEKAAGSKPATPA
jgi:hypothetical protein